MRDTFVGTGTSGTALNAIIAAMDAAVQPTSSVAPNINLLGLANQQNVVLNNSRAIFAVPAGTDTQANHPT